VKEQSHKAEMSAALRGDFERLRERGVSASLVPHETPEPDDPGSGVEPPAVEALEHAPELPPEALPQASAGRPAETAEEAEPARPGWLSRLVGR
jgi:hypothetical protein